MIEKNKKNPLLGLGNALKNKIGSIFTKKKKNDLPQPKEKDTIPSLTERPSAKRPFNIQLSEDDKEVYNVNDDEEEEEGDYEVEEEINTSVPKEPQDENLSSTRSNSVPVYISNEEQKNNIEINSNNFCHRIRKKGSVVNIDEVDYFKITRMKRKKTIFAKMGLSDDDYYPTEFLMFFEEQFIYFIKDVEIDKKNKKLRKIGSHYSFFQVSNIQFEEDIDNQTIVRIEMIKEENSYFSKEFFIDSSLVPKLTQYISFCFKALGLETNEAAS